MVELKATTPAAPLSNYAGYKASIANAAKQNIAQKVDDAVKVSFDITDNRSLYY